MLFTGLLFFVKPGYVIAGMVFVILSNLGYSASENFVSSFLPDIEGKENMERVSGYAWSFSYVGGLLSLGICLAILMRAPGGATAAPAGVATAGSYLPVRLCALVTAFFLPVPRSRPSYGCASGVR